MIGICLPGSAYFYYILTVCLGFPSWGPHSIPFGTHIMRTLGFYMGIFSDGWGQVLLI